MTDGRTDRIAMAITALALYVCVCAAVDNVLQRMTIVGVLLSFRCLAQEALLDVRDIFD